MLSPLPIDQLQHTFPYHDLITPPTPEFPTSALAFPTTTAFYTPFSTVGELDAFSPPNHFPSLQVSPPTSTRSISYSPYNSPYHQLPSPMSSNTTISTTYSSPFPYTPNHLPNAAYSPIVASPSSFHSMSLSSTPAMGPVPSLPSAPMPAFVSMSEPPVSPEKALVPSPSRQEVPQKLGLVSTRAVFRAEAFSVGSNPGVRVRDVLHSKVEVDGHDDRVFETTGVRQFRFVIDVSPSVLSLFAEAQWSFRFVVVVAWIRVVWNVYPRAKERWWIHHPRRTCEGGMPAHRDVHAESGKLLSSVVCLVTCVDIPHRILEEENPIEPRGRSLHHRPRKSTTRHYHR